jgi:hypothetical protein
MNAGDTTVLGFLSKTSCINEENNISLMVLPENMASSRSLGHLGKVLFVLYIWSSSSSSDSEAVGDFWGYSTFLELDPASYTGFFFFNNYGVNEYWTHYLHRVHLIHGQERISLSSISSSKKNGSNLV